jgi:hypothetical protein
VCICATTLLIAFLLFCPLMTASFAATHTLYPIEQR